MRERLPREYESALDYIKEATQPRYGTSTYAINIGRLIDYAENLMNKAQGERLIRKIVKERQKDPKRFDQMLWDSDAKGYQDVYMALYEELISFMVEDYGYDSDDVQEVLMYMSVGQTQDWLPDIDDIED